MSLKAWDELQLKFDLDLDEVADDAAARSISPEQARQISEAARNQLALELEEQNPAWLDDYMLLLQQGWPWRVACYIAWASAPKATRRPKTLDELAKGVLGLTSPRVVYSWRNKYPAIDTTIGMMQGAVLFQHRRDILEALAEMASRPDYKAFNDRKLALEMMGDYTPKSKLEFSRTARDLSELSDAELDRLIGTGAVDISSPYDLPTSEDDGGEA